MWGQEAMACAMMKRALCFINVCFNPRDTAMSRFPIAVLTSAFHLFLPPHLYFYTLHNLPCKRCPHTPGSSREQRLYTRVPSCSLDYPCLARYHCIAVLMLVAFFPMTYLLAEVTITRNNWSTRLIHFNQLDVCRPSMLMQTRKGVLSTVHLFCLINAHGECKCSRWLDKERTFIEAM